MKYKKGDEVRRIEFPFVQYGMVVVFTDKEGYLSDDDMKEEKKVADKYIKEELTGQETRQTAFGEVEYGDATHAYEAIGSIQNALGKKRSKMKDIIEALFGAILIMAFVVILWIALV